jgi:hypothetical protein
LEHPVIASNRRAGWSALRREKRRMPAESAVDLVEAQFSAAEGAGKGL